MERITRALERAHVQRQQLGDGRIAVLPAAAPPANPPAVDFTDTVIFRTPAIELSSAVRESERILPPGAAGPHGGAYKMLRTQVLRRLDQLGANAIGILSAGAGEGKTLTAINLAIAIAADPARTALLVDLDLRNPSIARRLHCSVEVGIEECLQTARPARDAMFKVQGYERLTIAPAREAVAQSSELLGSSRTAEVVRELRTRYANRIVIFDLPPVLQADDALAFTANLPAGLLVIGEGRTRRDDVSRTLQLLADLPFVGSVLNGSREPLATHY